MQITSVEIKHTQVNICLKLLDKSFFNSPTCTIVMHKTIYVIYCSNLKTYKNSDCNKELICDIIYEVLNCTCWLSSMHKWMGKGTTCPHTCKKRLTCAIFPVTPPTKANCSALSIATHVSAISNRKEQSNFPEQISYSCKGQNKTE